MKNNMGNTTRKKVLIVDCMTEGHREEFSDSNEFRNVVVEELDEDVIEVKIVKRKKTE